MIIQHLQRYLFALEKILAAASLLLLMVFILIQIIARNFFETGFAPLEIISRHLVLFVAFFGAALITQDQNHIKIDFLAHFISNKNKSRLHLPLSLLAAAICSVFAWHASRFWLDEWQYAAESERWVTGLALILPLGFSLLALHFVLLALNSHMNKTTT